jgi:hypothetical protein
VLLPDHCRKIWKTNLSSAIGIVVCIFLCLLGIGRQICPSAIGIVVCIFLCLLGIGRQICPSAIGIVVCIFLCLLGIGRQICPSEIGILFVLVCVFLELEDKFVQVQLELELELLYVSSFVIQKQISPLGCALLHNTKTNLWWVRTPIRGCCPRTPAGGPLAPRPPSRGDRPPSRGDGPPGPRRGGTPPLHSPTWKSVHTSGV